MSDVTLGILITTPQYRDAIHAAVAPVTSSVVLQPGQHVGLVDEDTAKVQPCEPFIGIVDPFLRKPVEPGEQFWLLLYPKTITSLRHQWTHPAFTADTKDIIAPKSESEQWLRDFAASVDIGYNCLMDGAKNWIRHEQYLNLGGLLEGQSVPDEFWSHYEAVTGAIIPERKRGSFFSCSC